MTPEPSALAWTEDRLFGGRLVVRQPRHGYRIAIDTVLLAASAGCSGNALVVDVGAGVGGAALVLAAEGKRRKVVALEADPSLASALDWNIQANGLGDRVHAIVGDVRAIPLAAACADLVVTNPPFARSGAGTLPKTTIGRAARHEGTVELQDWIGAAIALIRPGGHLVVVHRADRLGELLTALPPAVDILPLWPRSGAPAKRVLVRARVGRSGAARLLAGLVLHAPDGHFTAEADAILRGAASLSWE